MKWMLICIVGVLLCGPADSDPTQKDRTEFLVTKRPTDLKFYTSIARLNTCDVPGPPARFIFPSNIYPEESRRHKEQGTVLLQLVFDSVGCVRKASIVQSSGFYRLDNESLEYMMSLKLQMDKFHITQTDDGQPTALMPFNWKILKPYDPKDLCTQSLKCVDVAPPPSPAEEPGAAPEPDYVWMPGYYVYYPKTAYQWNEGHWDLGRPGYHWNSPQWRQAGLKWAFIPGNWEADK